MNEDISQEFKTLRDINMIKDCDCIIHAGPHWLHMAISDLRRNEKWFREALKKGIVIWQIKRVLGQKEYVRYRELRIQMERHGIEKIPDPYSLELKSQIPNILEDFLSKK